MNEVLIISDHLIMAGAERLIYELAYFAQQNNLKVTVLIANNYNTEYYDAVFKKMGIRVVRTSLQGLNKLRHPVNYFRALYWQTKLKHFAAKYFKSIHVIGLYNVHKVIDTVIHPNRFFWHVNNAVQHPEEHYPFSPANFQNAEDTIVYINPYQADEISRQYGDAIKCKTQIFKLFIAHE
jgi:hypothetical protein